MVDDINEKNQDKPIIANGRAPRKEVDLFPALADKRMVPATALRQNVPARIGTQISMFTPVSFEEALDIVECLRSRAATTISLENMKKLDASRLVDFVAGASAALDGDFHKLSEQVYLFCPSNIRITAPGKMVTANVTGVVGVSAATFATTSESLQSLTGDLGALDFLYPGQSSTGSSSSPWTNA